MQLARKAGASTPAARRASRASEGSPNQAFVDMVTGEGYADVHEHRAAAFERAELIATSAWETGPLKPSSRSSRPSCRGCRRAAREISDPIPDWAEHGAERKTVPYTVTDDMDAPNPTPERSTSTPTPSSTRRSTSTTASRSADGATAPWNVPPAWHRADDGRVRHRLHQHVHWQNPDGGFEHAILGCDYMMGGGDI